MVYGKGRATGYTDYYKNTSSTPGSNTDGLAAKPNDVTELSPEDQRKAAIRRRLQRRKAGK